MNILITGCNGQLGNEMQLLEKDFPQHQWFNTDVQELDISNQSAIEQFVAEHEIDGIVNCLPATLQWTRQRRGIRNSAPYSILLHLLTWLQR